MSKRKATKAANQTITARELKTWIDGYCSAHDKDWTPTQEQWNKILEKIASLETEYTHASPSAPAPTSSKRPSGQTLQQTAQPPSQPQSYDIPDMPAPPSLMTAASQQRAAMLRTSTGALKTPDLDSADAGNSFV